MGLHIFKTRKNKLRNELEFILKQKYPSQIELDFIILAYENYQKDN